MKQAVNPPLTLTRRSGLSQAFHPWWNSAVPAIAAIALHSPPQRRKIKVQSAIRIGRCTLILAPSGKLYVTNLSGLFNVSQWDSYPHLLDGIVRLGCISAKEATAHRAAERERKFKDHHAEDLAKFEGLAATLGIKLTRYQLKQLVLLNAKS